MPEGVTGRKYDYTCWIDGSLRITCDIKPMVYSLIDDGRSIAMHRHYRRDCLFDDMEACYIYGRVKRKAIMPQRVFYESEGMPKHWGLLETPFIIRKWGDEEVMRVMAEWWGQIERYSHRDQFSLTYVLWKNGKTIDWVFQLGGNVWKNPYFLYYYHN